MYKRIALTVLVSTGLVGLASAQNLQQRRATFMGGGGPDRGKCTIEVVIDTAAEVEVRGDNATLRTIAGQPAQWRRFECTGAMPQNPADFRFAGVDGRGRENLIRDPRNGGPAVIRIEDTSGGAEGYTFDIFWGNGYYGDRSDGRDGRYDRNDRNSADRFDGPRGGPRRRFTTQQAVDVCQASIRDQAARQFRTRNINFQRTALDDNPGRRDWVIGAFDVRRGGRNETFSFSCSVNFDSGQVRSADIQDRVRR